MKSKYILLSLATALLAACGGNEKAAEKSAASEKAQVKVTQVTSADIPQTETYTATVESDVKNNIAPNAPLRIEKIFVEVGDIVRKGQVLVQLDASNLQQLKLQIVFDQRIKRRKSFIHQKYIRIISKRPGYTYTLFHPA